jgi:hypothetical protein
MTVTDVTAFDPAAVVDARPLSPFAPQVLDFLADLSQGLLRDPACRKYPDAAAFAFWCRRASLEQEKREVSTAHRLGRGLVFHIAPGNVPVNFAYSLVAGLLAGNANIVRMPSAEFAQVDFLVEHLAATVRSGHEGLARYIGLTRYDRTDRARTDEFSARCDVRVIWGGDQTIADIRRSPLPARSFDVTFADRFSLCVLDAAAYLAEPDAAAVAQGFFNDTYLFDQNACTAPHLVVWLGADSDVTKAQTRFWDALHALVEREYSLAPVSAVDKLTAAYRFAAEHDGSHLAARTDNLIVRTELDDLPPDVDRFHASCGLFFERHASSLEEVVPLVTPRYQTLSYLGFSHEDLREWVLAAGLTGIDRIVPLGRTLDFSLRWDGYNLIETLSRVIVSC